MARFRQVNIDNSCTHHERWSFRTARSCCSRIFVQASALRGGEYDELSQGQRVEFEIVPGPEGPQADNVRPIRS